MNTLKGRMIASYSLISLLIIVILGILINFSVDKGFENYAITQRSQQIDSIISQVNQRFDEGTDLYNVDGLEMIGNAALQNGIFMHVQTLKKEIDWDIQQHKAQECMIQLQHTDKNMHSLYPNFQGGYTEDTYDLKYNDKVVGYLTAGYYGPYSLNDNELILIKGLNRSIIILGVVFLLIAIIFGIFMARHVAAPIVKATKAAQKIAGGDFEVQIQETTSMRETARLINSINEMAEELKRNEQQKKQLSADVAHELRTPLNNLQSHMEAMIDKIWEPSTERLQSCHVEIMRLIQIVTQLQDLYTLESKNTHIENDYFDFIDLYKSIFTDFEMTIKSKGIRLMGQIPSPAPIYANMPRLKQCMVNLISNAIHYTPEGKNVTVLYEKQENHIELRVCDEGSGIAAEELSHIFERFYRVDKSRSYMTGGMGVGLSITKAIIEAHGGTIYAESQKETGTTFIISLPWGDFDNHHKIPISLS